MGGQVVTIARRHRPAASRSWSRPSPTYQSLLATQEDYYRRGRFADVFASVKRAPEALAARLAEIPGIGVLETRVAEDVTIDPPRRRRAADRRISSRCQTMRRRLLNRLYLREGRPIEPGAHDEVLVGEAFATANRSVPAAR